MKDLVANLQRDHFIDKEKINGNDEIVRSLNEELKQRMAEGASIQKQNNELIRMIRELERQFEAQKININDMKIEHEVILVQMRKRVSDLEEELERYKRKYGEKLEMV
jgi:uncharacterized sporulation protein YeaH/YhbH (DUF444 family)